MRILIIEDDERIAQNVKEYLEASGFVVEVSNDGEDGEFLALEESFDAIVLDINLPFKDGFDIITSLREKDIATPVLMLTAYSDVEFRIKGLNLGADEYLSKPFSMQELVARIHALIRRNSKDMSPTIKIHDLEIDPLAHTVTVKGAPINLPAKEFAILEFLARNRGNVVTRSMLLDHVWGSEFETLSNVVDVYIKNLRTKIDGAGQKNFIQTIRGKGYVIKAPTKT